MEEIVFGSRAPKRKIPMKYRKIIIYGALTTFLVLLPYSIKNRPNDHDPTQEKRIHVSVDVQSIDDIIKNLTAEEREQLKEDILSGRESSLYRELGKYFTAKPNK
jgi:hypothetical protein